MKRKILFASILIVAILVFVKIIFAQKEIIMIQSNTNSSLVGTSFPAMEVQSLSKIKMDLPTYTFGKPTILCIVFDQNAQFKVDTWTLPILDKYKNEEVNYLEIPMINANYKWVSRFIDNGMRGGVPEELHKHVATYYGKLNDYKNILQMVDKNSCYLFLLDKQGIIQYTTSGIASVEKVSELNTAIEKL
jgi:ATP10 protein